MNSDNERDMLKGIYIAVIIANVTFFTSVLVLPQLLQDPSVCEKTIYVVDDTFDVTRIDTIVLRTRFLDFKMMAFNGESPSKEENKTVVYSYKNFRFNHHKALFVWIIVFSIGLSLSIAMILPLWFLITEKLDSKKNRKTLIYSIVSFGIFSLIVFFLAHFWGTENYFSLYKIQELGILFGVKYKWLLIPVIFYFIGPALSLAGNFLIFQKFISKETTNDYTLDDINELREYFSWFLVCSSVVLVMGIITSSLFRLSILELFDSNFDYIFPSEFLIIYGLIFSFLLMIFYLPNHLLLKSQLDSKKKCLSEDEKSKINISNSQFQIFKVSLSIFAPVISSLILEWLI